MVLEEVIGQWPPFTTELKERQQMHIGVPLIPSNELNGYTLSFYDGRSIKKIMDHNGVKDTDLLQPLRLYYKVCMAYR